MYISQDGNITEKYVISGDHPSDGDDSKEYTVLPRISIFNNESIELDLSSVRIIKFDSDTPEYIEPYKIIVEWGDGKSNEIVKKIGKMESTVAGVDSEWKKISHNYATEEYITESTINVKCFNIFASSFTFKIPYDLIYKSLSDIGTKFKIISANIRNDGETSYVLKHDATDSIVFITSKIK